MSDNYLTIYGASDDLIEVDGRISEEYNVPGEGGVEVVIRNDGKIAKFVVQCEFRDVWMTAVAAGANDFDVEVTFTQRPDRDEDAAVHFTLAGNDEVTVQLL